MRPAWTLAPGVLALAVAAAVGSATGQEAPPPVAPAQLSALSRTLAAAVDRAALAVVRIRPAPAPGAKSEPRTRTGVLVRPGVVVTAADDVEALLAGPIEVEDALGTTAPAELSGRDLRLRVVVLKAPALRHPAPPRAAPHSAGAFCLALGAVLRQGRTPTATLGIVSARGRFAGRALQHDAPVDGANVGGPLIDLEGALIGVVVRPNGTSSSRSGVGFAVPIDRIDAVLDRLVAGDQLEPGWLGLELPKFAGEDERGGVELAAVDPRGPAAAAGLQPGDRVLSLGSRSTPTLRAFREAASFLYAGQTVEVELLRAGERRRLRLRVLPKVR